jgi:NADPH-dependent 2,4-dienoyl-CoA reductase/sulfur reductase-like enzyme
LTAARTGLNVEEAQSIGLDAGRAVIQTGSRAHYYPGGAPMTIVVAADKKSRRLLGAEMVGADGVAHRINTFAAALAAGMTLDEVHQLDLAYAPPFSPVWDPVLTACEVAGKKIRD